MQASVQEVSPEVVENIGDDLFSGITGDLLPGASAASPQINPRVEKQDEGAEDNPESLDISDLMPGSVPAEPKQEKPAPKAEESKPGELKPEDVLDASTLASDKLPEDLIREEDADKVFKGDAKAKGAFLKERAYNKTLREQLKDAQSALMAAKADAVAATEAEKFKTEVEEYKKKVETLESDIGKLDLTRSPTFRQQYDDRINQIGGKMVEVLAKEGVDQNEAVQFVRQLISEQKPSVRERLIDDMAPGLKGTLSALGIQVDEVVQNRAVALENWKSTAAALEELDTRKRVADMTGKVSEYVSAAVEEAKKLGNPYYVETKDEAWNQEVAQRQDALKGVLLSGDMSKIASFVAEGLTAADLRVRYAKLLKQKRETDSELDAVLKGSPRFSGRPQTPTSGLAEPKRSEVHAVPLEDAITNDLLPPKPR
jgi:hypothetical protein